MPYKGLGTSYPSPASRPGAVVKIMRCLFCLLATELPCNQAAALLSSWLPLPPALPGLAGFRISHLRFSYLQAHLVPRATFHGQDMAVLWLQSQAKPISTEGPSLSGFAGHQGDPRRKSLNVPQQELKKSPEFQGRCLPDVHEEGDHRVDFSVNLCTSCHSEEEQEASILFVTPHA